VWFCWLSRGVPRGGSATSVTQSDADVKADNMVNPSQSGSCVLRSMWMMGLQTFRNVLGRYIQKGRFGFGY
jgi:hypothetical protein